MSESGGDIISVQRGDFIGIRSDGFTMPFATADVIYVNAGTTGPAASWLDNLNDGGRLLFR